MDRLATLLNKYCPSGVGKEGAIKLNLEELDQVLQDGSRWALKNGYATEADLARTEESGSLEGADPNKVSDRAKERGREQIGSLGAGNHFIEVDVVDQIFNEEAANAMGIYQGCLVLQIHCGSRGLDIKSAPTMCNHFRTQCANMILFCLTGSWSVRQ